MGGGKCSRKLKMLMPNRRKMAQKCWIFHGMERTVMGAGMAERLCVLAFLLSSRVGMTNLRMGMTNLRMGMTNLRMGLTSPRVGMTGPLSDSSLLLSRQSVQSCDKTTFASIFLLHKSSRFVQSLAQILYLCARILARVGGALHLAHSDAPLSRRVIIANLLRYHRIRAWSCTSVHSLRPHPRRLASRPF